MKKSTLICAGIDTGKGKLDAAIDSHPDCLLVNNDLDGHAALGPRGSKSMPSSASASSFDELRMSGGYQRMIVAHLRAQGFEVNLFQPKQVRAYAMFRLQRAKPFGSSPRIKGI